MIVSEKVPCNGCTACCQHDLIFLHPEQGDLVASYETFEVTNPLTGEHGLALKHKPEGGCWYVTDQGCSIHERAPAICRHFDCRKMLVSFMQLSRADRRRLQKAMHRKNLMSEEVLAAAAARLDTLPRR